ncbi:hypothetical protein [Pseudoalteromonas rubra]|uniref:Aminoglycoside phosphotransferase domain-containing protein n=1 Tax=Pseudoalteromonas rubra TaxID=43658 RepID=A0A5S3X395_9GAMM|nr:hypothetical protein [Pseudoalteromonas rubra]TMP38177.1 hypothetical protein CWB98_07615 [Pseudoalteromonas rubra]
MQLKAIWRYFSNRTTERHKMTSIYGKLCTMLHDRQIPVNTPSTFTLNHADFRPGNLIVKLARFDEITSMLLNVAS